jgi:DNA-binding LacI/PurR family transcriptional regulator
LVRKHGIGIFVSPELRRGISLVCNPKFLQRAEIPEYWRLIVGEATARLEQQGRPLSFHFSTLASDGQAPLHDDFMKSIEAGRVSGVIGVALDDAATQWILERQVPFVAYASYAPVTAGMDMKKMMAFAVEALAAQGCRNVGMWGTTWLHDESGAVSPQHKQPEISLFKTLLKSQHVPFSPQLVRNGNALKADGTRNNNFEQGYNLACTTFEQPRETWPDGLVITNDELTQGVMTALQRLRVKVPQDVVIATHANRGSWVLQAHQDRIILVEFDPGELVQALFNLLETLMRGETPPQKLFDVEPHVRVGEILRQGR